VSLKWKVLVVAQYLLGRGAGLVPKVDLVGDECGVFAVRVDDIEGGLCGRTAVGEGGVVGSECE
jgi:hypothetical protein